MSLKTHKQLMHVAVLTALISGCGGGGDGASGQNSGSQHTKPPAQTTPAQTGSLSITVNAMDSQSKTEQLQNHLSSGVVGRSDIFQDSDDAVSYPSKHQPALAGRHAPAGEQATLKPDLDLTASQYVISGTGPENSAFSQTLTSGNNLQLDFLRFGQWDITVEAKNAASERFAQGTKAVNINVGEVTSTAIDLSLIEGTGSFTLNLEFPEASVQGEVMSAMLKPETGESIQLSLQPGPVKTGFKTYTATLSNTVPSGYYTLIVTVHDQGNNGVQHLALGVAETVQILADQITIGQYSLTGAAGLGSVNFEFNLDLNENLPVSLIGSSQYATTFAFDSDTIIAASAGITANDVDAANVTYVWYLNGQVVAVDTSNYTLDSRFSPFTTSVNGRFIPGSYRLDVVAFNADASRSGSASFEFEVTGDPVGSQESASMRSRVGYQVVSNGISRFTALPQAQASLSGRHVNVDQFGQLSIDNVPVGEHVLSVQAPGFFPYYKRIELQGDEILTLGKINLTEGHTVQFTATQPTNIDIGGDLARIDFAPNSIAYENGDLYTSQVQIQYTALNPLSDQFYSTFPGEFKGQIADGSLVDIISYGVIAAELSDTNGTPLQIKDGHFADIRIKVADPATAPETMPLWHLNEETGTWTHEGNATLSGDYYVGQVGHFSWWNFDYQLDGERAGYRNMNVTVQDAAGQAIPNAEVTLTSKAGFSYQQSYTTNQQGQTSARALFTKSATQTPDSLFYEIVATYQDLTSGPQTLRFFPDRWGTVDQNGNEIPLNDVVLTLQQQVATFKGEAVLDDTRQPLVDNGPSLIFTERTPTIELNFANQGAGTLNINDVSLTPAGKYRLSSMPTWPQTLEQDESTKFNVTYLGDFSTTDKATLTVANNSLNEQIDIPFAAVAVLNGLYAETQELAVEPQYKGSIIKSSYTDYYQGGVMIDRGNGINLRESQDYISRGYMAFDLSGLPKNARITRAELVFNRIAAYGGFKVYISEQGQLLQPDDFNLPCDPVTPVCLLTTIEPPRGTTLNYAAPLLVSELTRLETITNSNDQLLKLMFVGNEGSNGYINVNDVQLVIEYAQ
ncbi:Ig-like domain-containing protein [Pseudoalteromonas rubra]|uniref:Carboxypeptidase regulatory-like domain-containing protein n=1 Tax=Pseudoalteromonas rubra TaxID=43658 RepID=A0A0F4QCW5_9GAMM|nr:Ig-like domain-containing protein [Pseudoalteromonas rubra]KJZ05498.1 hypothetical protein TW77_22605 [Pseudoalteromonas rubra]